MNVKVFNLMSKLMKKHIYLDMKLVKVNVD